MKDLFFILLIVFQLLIWLFPIIGKLSKEQNSDSKVTILGKITIAFSIIAFGLTIAIYYISNDEQLNERTQFDNKIRVRDSTHQLREDSLASEYRKQIDSSYSKSITASNDALAKYNLRLVDSLKIVAEGMDGKNSNPLLKIPPFGDEERRIFMSGDTIKIQFYSYYAISYNIEITCHLFNRNTLKYINSTNIFDIRQRKSLIPDQKATGGLFVYDASPTFIPKYDLVLVLTGSYTKKPDDRRKIMYNEIYTFNASQNKLVTPLVIDFIKFERFLNNDRQFVGTSLAPFIIRR